MCGGIPLEALVKQQTRLSTYWKSRGVLVAAACPTCGQTDQGQTGEYPCPECGLPRMWDRPAGARPPRKPGTAKPGTKRKPMTA